MEKMKRGRHGDKRHTRIEDTAVLPIAWEMIAQAPRPARAIGIASAAPTSAPARFLSSRLRNFISRVRRAVWVSPSDARNTIEHVAAISGIAFGVEKKSAMNGDRPAPISVIRVPTPSVVQKAVERSFS